MIRHDTPPIWLFIRPPGGVILALSLASGTRKVKRIWARLARQRIQNHWLVGGFNNLEKY